MRSKHSILRIISSLLVYTFIFEQAAFANPDLLAPKKLDLFQKPKIDLKLPSSVASIEEAYIGSTQNKTIYLIQDAHTNPSGQKNLAKTLEVLLKQNNKPHYVFVEAGLGDNSLTSFRQYGTTKQRQQISEHYLQDGVLHGEEYLDLTSQLDFTIWGVEDMALYKKSLEDYKFVAQERQKFLSYLGRIQNTLNTLKPRLYNPALLSLDELSTKHLKENLSLTDFFEVLSFKAQSFGVSLDNYPALKALSTLKAKEDKINFKLASEEQLKAIQSLSKEDQTELLELSKNPSRLKGEDKESQAFYALLEEKLHNPSSYPELSKYFDYLKYSKEINPSRILKELKSLEEALYQSLSTTQDEKTLIKSQSNVYLLEKLFKLTLTPEEYKDYKTTTQDFTITQLTGFLNKKIMDLQTYYERALFLEEGYEQIVQHSQDFYELTFERDKHFINAMLKKIASSTSSPRNDRQSAVLITGGFHTPSLKALLKDQNISYVSITPQVLQETNMPRYEKLLLNQTLPQIPATLLTSSHTLRLFESGAALVGSELQAFGRNPQVGFAGARMANKKSKPSPSVIARIAAAAGWIITTPSKSDPLRPRAKVLVKTKSTGARLTSARIFRDIREIETILVVSTSMDSRTIEWTRKNFRKLSEAGKLNPKLQIRFISDFKKAITAVTEATPDVILTGHVLGGVTAIDLIREVNPKQGTPFHIPIVVLSREIEPHEQAQFQQFQSEGRMMGYLNVPSSRIYSEIYGKATILEALQLVVSKPAARLSKNGNGHGWILLPIATVLSGLLLYFNQNPKQKSPELAPKPLSKADVQSIKRSAQGVGESKSVISALDVIENSSASESNQNAAVQSLIVGLKTYPQREMIVSGMIEQLEDPRTSYSALANMAKVLAGLKESKAIPALKQASRRLMDTQMLLSAKPDSVIDMNKITRALTVVKQALLDLQPGGARLTATAESPSKGLTSIQRVNLSDDSLYFHTLNEAAPENILNWLNVRTGPMGGGPGSPSVTIQFRYTLPGRLGGATRETEWVGLGQTATIPYEGHRILLTLKEVAPKTGSRAFSPGRLSTIVYADVKVEAESGEPTLSFEVHHGARLADTTTLTVDTPLIWSPDINTVVRFIPKAHASGHISYEAQMNGELVGVLAVNFSDSTSIFGNAYWFSEGDPSFSRVREELRKAFGADPAFVQQPWTQVFTTVGLRRATSAELVSRITGARLSVDLKTLEKEMNAVLKKHSAYAWPPPPEVASSNTREVAPRALQIQLSQEISQGSPQTRTGFTSSGTAVDPTTVTPGFWVSPSEFDLLALFSRLEKMASTPLAEDAEWNALKQTYLAKPEVKEALQRIREPWAITSETFAKGKKPTAEMDEAIDTDPPYFYVKRLLGTDETRTFLFALKIHAYLNEINPYFGAPGSPSMSFSSNAEGLAKQLDGAWADYRFGLRIHARADGNLIHFYLEAPNFPNQDGVGNESFNQQLLIETTRFISWQPASSVRDVTSSASGIFVDALNKAYQLIEENVPVGARLSSSPEFSSMGKGKYYQGERIDLGEDGYLIIKNITYDPTSDGLGTKTAMVEHFSLEGTSKIERQVYFYQAEGTLFGKSKVRIWHIGQEADGKLFIQLEKIEPSVAVIQINPKVSPTPPTPAAARLSEAPSFEIDLANPGKGFRKLLAEVRKSKGEKRILGSKSVVTVTKNGFKVETYGYFYKFIQFELNQGGLRIYGRNYIEDLPGFVSLNFKRSGVLSAKGNYNGGFFKPTVAFGLGANLKIQVQFDPPTAATLENDKFFTVTLDPNAYELMAQKLDNANIGFLSENGSVAAPYIRFVKSPAARLTFSPIGKGKFYEGEKVDLGEDGYLIIKSITYDPTSTGLGTKVAVVEHFSQNGTSQGEKSLFFYSTNEATSPAGILLGMSSRIRIWNIGQEADNRRFIQLEKVGPITISLAPTLKVDPPAPGTPAAARLSGKLRRPDHPTVWESPFAVVEYAKNAHLTPTELLDFLLYERSVLNQTRGTPTARDLYARPSNIFGPFLAGEMIKRAQETFKTYTGSRQKYWSLSYHGGRMELLGLAGWILEEYSGVEGINVHARPHDQFIFTPQEALQLARLFAMPGIKQVYGRNIKSFDEIDNAELDAEQFLDHLFGSLELNAYGTKDSSLALSFANYKPLKKYTNRLFTNHKKRLRKVTDSLMAIKPLRTDKREEWQILMDTVKGQSEKSGNFERNIRDIIKKIRSKSGARLTRESEAFLEHYASLRPASDKEVAIWLRDPEIARRDIKRVVEVFSTTIYPAVQESLAGILGVIGSNNPQAIRALIKYGLDSNGSAVVVASLNALSKLDPLKAVKSAFHLLDQLHHPRHHFHSQWDVLVAVARILEMAKKQSIPVDFERVVEPFRKGEERLDRDFFKLTSPHMRTYVGVLRTNLKKIKVSLGAPIAGARLSTTTDVQYVQGQHVQVLVLTTSEGAAMPEWLPAVVKKINGDGIEVEITGGDSDFQGSREFVPAKDISSRLQSAARLAEIKADLIKLADWLSANEARLKTQLVGAHDPGRSRPLDSKEVTQPIKQTLKSIKAVIKEIDRKETANFALMKELNENLSALFLLTYYSMKGASAPVLRTLRNKIEVLEEHFEKLEVKIPAVARPTGNSTTAFRTVFAGKNLRHDQEAFFVKDSSVKVLELSGRSEYSELYFYDKTQLKKNADIIGQLCILRLEYYVEAEAITLRWAGMPREKNSRKILEKNLPAIRRMIRAFIQQSGKDIEFSDETSVGARLSTMSEYAESLPEGFEAFDLVTPSFEGFNSVTPSKREPLLLAYSKTMKKFIIWDPIEQEITKNIPINVAGKLKKATLSPDGKKIVGFSYRGATSASLYLWDVKTESLQGSANGNLADSGRPSAVKFSPDGHKLVVGYEFGTVEVFDTEIFNTLGEPKASYFDQNAGSKFKTQSGSVSQIVFSGNGRYIATASSSPKDLTVEVADMQEERPIFVCKDLNSPAIHLHLSHTGKVLTIFTERLSHSYSTGRTARLLSKKHLTHHAAARLSEQVDAKLTEIFEGVELQQAKQIRFFMTPKEYLEVLNAIGSKAEWEALTVGSKMLGFKFDPQNQAHKFLVFFEYVTSAPFLTKDGQIDIAKLHDVRYETFELPASAAPGQAARLSDQIVPGSAKFIRSGNGFEIVSEFSVTAGGQIFNLLLDETDLQIFMDFKPGRSDLELSYNVTWGGDDTLFMRVVFIEHEGRLYPNHVDWPNEKTVASVPANEMELQRVIRELTDGLPFDSTNPNFVAARLSSLADLTQVGFRKARQMVLGARVLRQAFSRSVLGFLTGTEEFRKKVGLAPLASKEPKVLMANGEDSGVRVENPYSAREKLLASPTQQISGIYELRGVDGGSSHDLNAFQKIYTFLKNKLFPSTLTIAGKQAIRITIRPTSEANKNKIIYKSPHHPDGRFDFDHPYEYISEGEAQIVDSDKPGHTKQLKNGTLDLAAYTLQNLYGLTGLEVTLEYVMAPDSKSEDGEEAYTSVVGGFGSSGAYAAGIVDLASILAEKPLSKGQVLYTEVKIENELLNNHTGGQEGASTLFPGAAIHHWLSWLGPEEGKAYSDYAALTEIPDLSDADLDWLESHLALVVDKEFENGKAVINRTASLTNDLWMLLNSVGDPVGLAHVQTLPLPGEIVEAIKKRDIKTIINAFNLHADIRDKMTKRALFLALHPEDESLTPEAREYAKLFKEYYDASPTLQKLNKDYAAQGRKLEDVSTYSEHTESYRGKVRGLGGASFSSGAGGIGSGTFIFIPEGVQKEAFMEQAGIPALPKKGIKDMIQGAGRHHLRGYFSFEISRSRGPIYQGLEEAGFKQFEGNDQVTFDGEKMTSFAAARLAFSPLVTNVAEIQQKAQAADVVLTRKEVQGVGVWQLSLDSEGKDSITVSEIGANVLGLVQGGGPNRIWDANDGQKLFDANGKPEALGSHTMGPWTGRMEEGKVALANGGVADVKNAPYIRMTGAHANHGVFNKLPWALTDVGRDAEGVFMTFSIDTSQIEGIVSHQELNKVAGDYRVSITFHVSQNKQTESWVVENLRDEERLASFGRHSNYLFGDVNLLELTVPNTEYWVVKSAAEPLTLYQKPLPATGATNFFNGRRLSETTEAGLTGLIPDADGFVRSTIRNVETGEKWTISTQDPILTNVMVYVPHGANASQPKDLVSVQAYNTSSAGAANLHARGITEANVVVMKRLGTIQFGTSLVHTPAITQLAAARLAENLDKEAAQLKQIAESTKTLPIEKDRWSEKEATIIETNVLDWLSAHDSIVSPRHKAAIRKLLDEKDYTKLKNGFLKEEGIIWPTTAGFRGPMEDVENGLVGPNYIGEVLMRQYADIYRLMFSSKGLSADSYAYGFGEVRPNTEIYGKILTVGMAAAGVKVIRYFNPKVRPFSTPLVAHAAQYFAKKYGHAPAAGFTISGSHNGLKDNGVKLQNWAGAQLLPNEVEELKPFKRSLKDIEPLPSEESLQEHLVEMTDAEYEELLNDYFDAQEKAFEPGFKEVIRKACAAGFDFVFTPLNGSTREETERFIVERIGLVKGKDFFIPEDETILPQSAEGMDYQGKGQRHPAWQYVNFDPARAGFLDKTAAFADKATATGVKTVTARDLDGDRFVVTVKMGDGKWKDLDGNQNAVVQLHELLSTLKAEADAGSEESRRMLENFVLIRTHVTSPLLDTIALSFGVKPENIVVVPVGFKYFGSINMRKIGQWGRSTYGAEESYGTFNGVDPEKDSLSGMINMLIVASKSYMEGQNVYQKLMAIYEKYGYTGDETTKYKIPGQGPAEVEQNKQKVLTALSEMKAGEMIGDRYRIIKIDHKFEAPLYSQGELLQDGYRFFVEDIETGKQVLMIIRGSGTEPIFKYYFFWVDPLKPDTAAGQTADDVVTATKQYLAGVFRPNVENMFKQLLGARLSAVEDLDRTSGVDIDEETSVTPTAAARLSEATTNTEFIRVQIGKLESNYTARNIQWEKTQPTVENEQKVYQSIAETSSVLAELLQAVDANASLAKEKIKIFQAVELVFNEQGSALRKDLKFYPVHPLQAALNFIQRLGITDPEFILSAILHDTIEDVARFNQNPDLIGEMFGGKVQTNVQSVTNKELPKAAKDWLGAQGVSGESMKAMEYQLGVAREITQSVDTLLLKSADFSDNALKLGNLSGNPKLQQRLAAKYGVLIQIFSEEFRALADNEALKGSQANVSVTGLRALAEEYEAAERQVSEWARNWEAYGQLNTSMQAVGIALGESGSSSKILRKFVDVYLPAGTHGARLADLQTFLGDSWRLVSAGSGVFKVTPTVPQLHKRTIELPSSEELRRAGWVVIGGDDNKDEFLLSNVEETEEPGRRFTGARLAQSKVKRPTKRAVKAVAVDPAVEIYTVEHPTTLVKFTEKKLREWATAKGLKPEDVETLAYVWNKESNLKLYTKKADLLLGDRVMIFFTPESAEESAPKIISIKVEPLGGPYKQESALADWMVAAVRLEKLDPDGKYSTLEVLKVVTPEYEVLPNLRTTQVRPGVTVFFLMSSKPAAFGARLSIISDRTDLVSSVISDLATAQRAIGIDLNVSAEEIAKKKRAPFVNLIGELNGAVARKSALAALLDIWIRNAEGFRSFLGKTQKENLRAVIMPLLGEVRAVQQKEIFGVKLGSVESILEGLLAASGSASDKDQIVTNLVHQLEEAKSSIGDVTSSSEKNTSVLIATVNDQRSRQLALATILEQLSDYLGGLIVMLQRESSTRDILARIELIYSEINQTQIKIERLTEDVQDGTQLNAKLETAKAELRRLRTMLRAAARLAAPKVEVSETSIQVGEQTLTLPRPIVEVLAFLNRLKSQGAFKNAIQPFQRVTGSTTAIASGFDDPAKGIKAPIFDLKLYEGQRALEGFLKENVGEALAPAKAPVAGVARPLPPSPGASQTGELTIVTRPAEEKKIPAAPAAPSEGKTTIMNKANRQFEPTYTGVILLEQSVKSGAESHPVSEQIRNTPDIMDRNPSKVNLAVFNALAAALGKTILTQQFNGQDYLYIHSKASEETPFLSHGVDPRSDANPDFNGFVLTPNFGIVAHFAGTYQQAYASFLTGETRLGSGHFPEDRPGEVRQLRPDSSYFSVGKHTLLGVARHKKTGAITFIIDNMGDDNRMTYLSENLATPVVNLIGSPEGKKVLRRLAEVSKLGGVEVQLATLEYLEANAADFEFPMIWPANVTSTSPAARLAVSAQPATPVEARLRVQAPALEKVQTSAGTRISFFRGLLLAGILALGSFHEVALADESSISASVYKVTRTNTEVIAEPKEEGGEVIRVTADKSEKTITLESGTKISVTELHAMTSQMYDLVSSDLKGIALSEDQRVVTINLDFLPRGSSQEIFIKRLLAALEFAKTQSYGKGVIFHLEGDLSLIQAALQAQGDSSLFVTTLPESLKDAKASRLASNLVQGKAINVLVAPLDENGVFPFAAATRLAIYAANEDPNNPSAGYTRALERLSGTRLSDSSILRGIMKGTLSLILALQYAIHPMTQAIENNLQLLKLETRQVGRSA